MASGHRAVAEQFVDDTVAYCKSFETFPERETQRDDLVLGLRTIGYRRRGTIAFCVDTADSVVMILGIFYGDQDSESEIIPTGRGNN